jgi:hypothetical protein
MKYLATFLIFFASGTLVLKSAHSHADFAIPQLNKQPFNTQLIVDGKPFIILGGELGNSSASDKGYIDKLWPTISALHLNTVLVPIYWDLIEPKENQFDFALVDHVLERARANNMKLVLLWFGSWKNSMSCYTPSWVKRDQRRFPLAQDNTGTSQQILTPFSNNNLQADIKAYSALLGHIKAVDSKDRTVIMVQVENEIGMLPSARDYHPAANNAFQQSVPSLLIHYLHEHKDVLAPELKQLWQKNGFASEGNWENIFGKSLATDEIFIAWYFARYAQTVAAAGKAIYPLPTYVNAALNRPDAVPGKYPSGGPLPHLLDIWKAAAPDIDLLSPDFYNPNFTQWNNLYTRQGEGLFIPEIRFEASNAAKAFYALGHYGALGFSPFSIESTDKPSQEPISKAYKILQPLIPLITTAKLQKQLAGALVDKKNSEQRIQLGNIIFTVKHDYTLGWSDKAKDEFWPESGAIIIQTGAEEFYVAGTGVVVTMRSTQEKILLGIDSIFEGTFVDGQWQQGRSLNGDEDHQGRHLRIPVDEFSTQKLRLYTFH